MSSKDSGLKRVSNPPFKPFIDYRIGDYNTFRKVMLGLIKKNALLGRAPVPKSDKKDYGAALVDMWAYLCDILTYYQERIATESFLRTSRLEESIIELLYLVDYLPQRGRSAFTLVRFIANEKTVPPPSPSSSPLMESAVIIPKGFKIRSVPAKGQEAIIFETDEPSVISSDHNLMKLDGWRTSYKIEQGTTRLFLDKIYPELNVGDLVMISDDKNIDVVRIVKKVDKDGKSQIAWAEEKALSSDYYLSKTRIQKFVQLVRPFGYNAPPSILSNVELTLYTKKSDADGDEDNSNNSNNTGENREPVSQRLVQLVDVSDRAIASATSDENGKLTFRALTPGTYRFLIARSGIMREESQIHPITTISSNRFQLLPGFEFRFDAELVFGVEALQPVTDIFKQFIQQLRENLLAERGSNIAGSNPFLSDILENIDKGTDSDLRPGLNLTPQEPFSFDPVNEDILTTKVYLDKVYGNIKQGSFVILSKDDPSNQIDESRQLFKISHTGQMFHAKYGIGGNASFINLKTIDGKKDEDEQKLIFCWEDILEELKEEGEGEGEGEGPRIQTTKLIDFINLINNDIHALDPKTDRPIKIDNEEAIQITDKNQKNVYRIKLDKEKDKATLFKNDEKLLDFIVKVENVEAGMGGGEEADTNKKTNLYANKIESGLYNIRNTLIFTNPVMEIGVDPRYASQETTDEYAENITLEGMHTGLKSGVFLAIADNTSIIQGTVVDSNLNPLEGYRVAVYRIQKHEGSTTTSSSSSTVSMTAPPIEVIFQYTNAKGSFTFDDLRSDSYLLSLSLPLEKYWSIFVDHIFEEGGKNSRHNHDDNSQETEKREIINGLRSLENKGIVSSSSSEPDSNKRPIEDIDKDEDKEHRPAEVAKHHLEAFLKIIEVIRSKVITSKEEEEKEEKTKFADLESRFTVYIIDILDVISEIETSVKDKILPLIEAGSIETLAAASSSSSVYLLNSSLVDSINIIEQEAEPKLEELKAEAQQVLDRLTNERSSPSVSSVKEFTETTIPRMVSILEEILIIVKESLQSPFRSTIYQNNERLLGVTKTLNLESNTGKNITMAFNVRDKLTYVESMLQHSKFQVTKIAGEPTFSEGKTNLSLDPPLKYRYVKGFAEIYGNIVPASHGETVKDEILGSGDASAIHQEFTLRRGPISYVSSPLSPNGVKSTLKVIVNDIQWQERDDFLNSSPNDHHYVTSLNENGSIKITFGDGIRGSTLPTGVDNIHGQYRVGMGFKGNLQPNTPVVPQENNPAIKSVSIPAGSYGGAEKILTQQKRDYRPRILTLGRAVSLEDYSNIATIFGEISKARAYMIMKDGLETVVLIVAGQRGRVVGSALQMELQAYMDERRDIGIPLEIESFVPVPVDIVVEVKVNDSYRRSKVVSNIQTRLGPGIPYDSYRNSGGNNNKEEEATYQGSTSGREGNENEGFGHYYINSLFSFERLNFGQEVTLNEVYAIVETVPGVDFAVVTKFCRRGSDEGAATAVQEIISANHNEILQCENDPLDPIKGTIRVIAQGGVVEL
jgi:hypothetical protein